MWEKVVSVQRELKIQNHLQPSLKAIRDELWEAVTSAEKGKEPEVTEIEAPGDVSGVSGGLSARLLPAAFRLATNRWVWSGLVTYILLLLCCALKG